MERITPKLAMELQCHECMGHYSDGKQDCGVVNCSLYKWMPYREKDPDFSKFKYNPRRVGKVLWEDSRLNLTEEQRKERAQNMNRGK